MGAIMGAAGLAVFAAIAALILVSAVNGLYWPVSAARVSGTVIGVREHRGKEFVAVYRYTDQTGTMWEAMSEHGSPTLDLMQTGGKVDLLVFPSRPERVQEAGFVCSFRQLTIRVFRFLLSLAFVGILGSIIFFRFWSGAAGISDWIVVVAAILGAMLKIREIKRDVALEHYTAIELAENITPQRVEAVRAAAARDA